VLERRWDGAAIRNMPVVYARILRQWDREFQALDDDWYVSGKNGKTGFAWAAAMVDLTGLQKAPAGKDWTFDL
jgi:hypothetical protein